MTSKRSMIGFALAAALPLLAGCQPADEPEETAEPAPMEEPMEAEEPMDAEGPATAAATLEGPDGAPMGMVTFTEEEGGVHVVARIEGVEAAGMHGFHIHETGDCSAADFSSAGGHFNPENAPHACPPTTPRHAGDFGNVEISEDGNGNLDATSDLITLAAGPSSILGKAVLVHSGEDDCTSQPSGAAGDRIACGVIESAPANIEGEVDATGDDEAGDETEADDAY